MTTIPLKEVEAIAALCKLSLTDAEKEKFSAQLSDILSYVTKLNEVPTENVEVTNQVTDQVNANREDVAQETLSDEREALLKNIPQRDGDGVRVPTVLKT